MSEVYYAMVGQLFLVAFLIMSLLFSLQWIKVNSYLKTKHPEEWKNASPRAAKLGLGGIRGFNLFRIDSFIKKSSSLSKDSYLVDQAARLKCLNYFSLAMAIVTIVYGFSYAHFMPASPSVNNINHVVSAGSSTPESPADVSQWSTYSSQEFGYVLDYPEGWGVTEVGLSGYPSSDLARGVWITSLPTKEYFDNPQPGEMAFYINTYDNPSNVTLSQWRDNLLSNLYWSPQVLSSTVETIAGLPAIDVSYELTQGSFKGATERWVLLGDIPGGHMIQFELPYPYPPQPQYTASQDAVLNHVISSLLFTSSTQQ